MLSNEEQIVCRKWVDGFLENVQSAFGEGSVEALAMIFKRYHDDIDLYAPAVEPAIKIWAVLLVATFLRVRDSWTDYNKRRSEFQFDYIASILGLTREAFDRHYSKAMLVADTQKRELSTLGFLPFSGALSFDLLSDIYDELSPEENRTIPAPVEPGDEMNVLYKKVGIPPVRTNALEPKLVTGFFRVDSDLLAIGNGIARNNLV